MSKRRFIVRNRRKRKILFSILFIMLFMITIGYSTLSTKLNIGGSLGVSKVKCQTKNKLYNVLKCAVEDGLALEYTGAHQDSMDASKSTEKIYHWYAPSGTAGNSLANQILEKNNVIFANHCWQMIRTTDTGGVKMIYNGEAENNQCLNTRGTHVGYASSTSLLLLSNYWYGTDYTYDSATKTFKVSGTTEQTSWNDTTGPTLIGKYTCKGTTVDATCYTLYLIEDYHSPSSAYVISLKSDSNYSQFGFLQFNASYHSPSYVGYMYNTVYPYNSETMTSSETMLSSSSLATTYWYAHDAVWGNPTASRYNLDSPYQVSATTDYPNLVGEYTFRNAKQTYTNTSVYYIAAVNNTLMYYIQLQNSTNHNLADYNYTYTYGDSYTDNGDGTYTIDSPTTVNRSDWYTSYSNVGANKYVCKNAVNDTCSELWYTTATSNTSMTYIKVANNYKYAKGFTWDGSKYVLDNDASTSFWNINDSTNKTSINNAHYTCWNETGECTTISYIYYISGTTPYYINITNGKSVEDTINEMLHDNGVNQVNSTMKSGVDAWYKHYLLEDYDDYIEDTIFCNDRSIRALNGWNPDGGMTNAYLQFKEYKVTSDLSCTNTTDQFSISNNNAKLTYKVGLMSSPEMNILNNSNARKIGQYYWLASPYYFDLNDAASRSVDTFGGLNSYYVVGAFGVRPAVSLSSGVEFVDGGDGSMANPYYIGDVYNITNSFSMFHVKEKSPPGWEVKLESDDYVATSFKLNGTLVEGDSFIMPEEDVTITDIQYVVANYSITNSDSSVTVPNTGRYNSTITLEAEGYTILSFKLNGTLIEGNSFVMPAEDVVITEITKVAQVTIESEHNPYANNINNVTYYENTFEGATSITVELTYQTESTSYDWVYLYDTLGSTTPFNNKKYGGTTLKTETLTINSNYLKIVFKTDSSGNNFYGFKAVITPNY